MSYLTDRFAELVRQHPGTKQIGVMRDDIGVFALSIRTANNATALFCAKRNMAGHLVSCHKTIYETARQAKWPIVMAVGDAFYWFNPYKIQLGKTNVRDGVPMVHFGIEQGTKIPAPQPGPTLFTQT